MSMAWGKWITKDCLGSQETKQGVVTSKADANVEALPPAALYQNPIAHPGTPTRRDRPGAEPAYTPADRPDYPLLILKIVNIVAWTVVGIVLLNLYKLGII